MSETLEANDEMLATMIANYEISSKLQHDVLDHIRAMADAALPAAQDGMTKLTAGEATILLALSQQLDVLHSKMTQLEQLNLTVLRKLLEREG